MSELLALGISHQTAPVALRERVALPDSQAADFGREMVADGEIDEVVTISTCNRTELYLVVGDAVEAETTALGMLARRAGIRPTQLAESIYAYRNCDVARHLYRVSCGLESMIVGEAEVQGQVRRAYDTALEAGTTGSLTSRLFRAALQTGKRVRSETAIGTGRASVSSVAVALAQETLGELRERQVVVLGAGETSELTARALAAQGVQTMFVANRRRDRALALATRFGGRALSFDELPSALDAADIVVASTASPHPIITRGELGDVMRQRAGRPLLLIDIAVPRDVEPACQEIEGVTVRDIDDLQGLVARNRSVRRGEVGRAQAIIEEEIGHFAAWMGSLEVIPTVAALRARGDEVVASVLEENAGRWDSLGERDRDRVAAVARAVATRLLHEPTLRLKRTDDRVHARVQVLRELFALDEEAGGPAADPRYGAGASDLAADPRYGAGASDSAADPRHGAGASDSAAEPSADAQAPAPRDVDDGGGAVHRLPRREALGGRSGRRRR